jgi:GAF domain-containing protein
MSDERKAIAAAAEEAKRLLDQLVRENTSLKTEVARLTQEVADAREHLKKVERVSHTYEDRYMESEKANGNLASLYIATYNLHSTLDFGEVLRLLREIVVNLVGSESFGVYVRSATDDNLELLAGEGIDVVAQRTLHVDGIVEQALTSRRVAFAETQAPGFPLACVPLALAGEVLGVIVIYGLLAHKTAFETTDVELLEVVAAQAATAFYTARLHAKTGRASVRDLFVLPEYALAIATGERNA